MQLKVDLFVTPNASSVWKNQWLEKTETPFDPLEAAGQLTKKINCPKCNTLILARTLIIMLGDFVSIIVPAFINDEGNGYAQERFSLLCPNTSCNIKITKDTLAAGQFAGDVIALHRRQFEYVNIHPLLFIGEP